MSNFNGIFFFFQQAVHRYFLGKTTFIYVENTHRYNSFNNIMHGTRYRWMIFAVSGEQRAAGEYPRVAGN